MTTFLELKDEVKDVLDDTSLDVDVYINSALKYCGNFLPNSVIIETNPVSAGIAIPVPARCYRVKDISINSESITKLEDLSREDVAAKLQKQRWHATNTTIYFTVDLALQDDVKISFEQFYKPLVDDADVTDVISAIEPLIIICSVWMYYKKFITTVDTNREKYADVDPDEIRRACANMKKEFDDMLATLKLEY